MQNTVSCVSNPLTNVFYVLAKSSWQRTLNYKTEALALKRTKTNKRRLKFAFRLIQKIIPSSLSILSHRLFNNSGLSLKWLPQRGWGGGGRCRFQVTEMIKWGQKSKPQQIPEPKTNPQNIPESIKWYNTKITWLEIERLLCLRLGYAGTTTSLQIVLNSPKNPTL